MATEKLLIDLWTVNMNEVDTSDCTDVEDILSAVISYLSELPTVDAIEVVRCKDCKHYEKTEIGKKDRRMCTKFLGLTIPRPDDFCSNGEREENG